MADPRQTLHDLIHRFGTSLAEDPQRCKGMLRDLCGSSKREIAGLVAAIEEKVTTELLKPHPLLVSLRANMIRRLEDHRALTPDIAMWTVDTWGLALGIWTQAELDQFPPIAPPPSSTPPPVTNHSSEPILDLPVVEVEPPQLDLTQDLLLTASERQRGVKKAIVLDDNGKRLEVPLPGGLSVGQKIRLQGQGKRDPVTGTVGDLYLVVKEGAESFQPTTQVDIDPYQQSQVPQTEWNIDQVPLESEKGVYYQKLRNLLKAQNWAKADSETYRLMINIVGRTEGDWIRENELLHFPYKDLRTIDQLWQQASQGRYGFSIQKEIYVRCGAKLNGKYPGDAIWYEFCTVVGWRVNNQWKNYRDLTWNSIDVQGHLPNCQSLLGDWTSIFIPTIALRLINHNSTTLLTQQSAYQPLPKVPIVASQQAKTFKKRGFANFILGNNQDAIDDFSQGIQLKPDEAKNYYFRGITYQQMGNRILALADFQEAAKLYQQQGRISDYQDAQNRIRQNTSIGTGGTDNLTFDLPNNGGKLELIAVPAGTLVMEGGHRVQLPAFHIGKYPVTQRQYQAVMGQNPSHFSGQDNPVENVSWHDAQEFCTKLTGILKRQGGYEVNLPSETMWEWAARGATRSKGYTYAGSNNLDEVGWYIRNSSRKPHPVGQKKPNELGIYDMSGNVWEWCFDNYTNTIHELPQDGTPLTNGGYSSLRAVRGGSWKGSPYRCACVCRGSGTTDCKDELRGFRVSSEGFVVRRSI